MQEDRTGGAERRGGEYVCTYNRRDLSGGTGKPVSYTHLASKPKDYITAIDEKNIIIVKEIKEADTYEELDHVAKTLVDTLNVEAMSQVRVSYGNIIHEIKDVSRSYKEAKMALEVGKIFYADKIIVPYNNLGIGRLIYQLPIPLCQMFMKEVFGEQLPDTFDEETLTTINKFFENNLNVSETSRQLYVHRNTLVYLSLIHIFISLFR